MPKWEKIYASLEDVFDYGSKQESKDIQDLKLFGLYKDEKRDVEETGTTLYIDVIHGV